MTDACKTQAAAAREDMAPAETAATYSLLARLLGREVDEPLLAALREATWDAQGDGACAEGERLIGGWLCGVGEAPEDARAALTELAVDYARLFVVRSRSTTQAAYPFESVYVGDEGRMMGAARDDVRRIYRAAGFAPGAGWNVGEDHIALELEFASHLAARGDEAALADFRARHLANWAGRFAADMCSHAQTDFYRGVALYLAGWLA